MTVPAGPPARPHRRAGRPARSRRAAPHNSVITPSPCSASAPDPAPTLIRGCCRGPSATLTSCAAAMELMADSNSSSAGPGLPHPWMAGVRSAYGAQRMKWAQPRSQQNSSYRQIRQSAAIIYFLPSFGVPIALEPVEKRRAAPTLAVRASTSLRTLLSLYESSSSRSFTARNMLKLAIGGCQEANVYIPLMHE